MSKFFYKGRIDPRQKNESFGFKTKRTEKLGSEAHPLALNVQTEQRKLEVAAEAAELGVFVNITVSEEQAENVQALALLAQKPATQTFEQKPERNAPCPCGSGKKYKKCCG
jgi:SWIM/SEC-C metal-binding protein